MSRNKFYLFGHPIQASRSPLIHNSLFNELGLEGLKFELVDYPSIDGEGSTFLNIIRRDDFGGCSVTMPFKVIAMKYVDTLTEDAIAVGSINTIYVDKSTKSLVGTNTDIWGVYNSLLSRITGLLAPFPQKQYVFEESAGSAFIIGGGGAARAAVYALSILHLSSIYLVNRDKSETDALISQFPNIKLIAIDSINMANDICIDPSTPRFICAVGCIPALPPKTEAEKRVQAIAKIFFTRKFDHNDDKLTKNNDYHKTGILVIPLKPVFLDMAYNPPITPLLLTAEEQGWVPISGLCALVEQAFVADQLWLASSGEDIDSTQLQSKIATVRTMIYKGQEYCQ